MAASAQDSASSGADLTRFDVLNERGWNIPHPSVADTLLDDVGGMRSTLADAGIGVFGLSAPNLYVTDLSRSNTGKPRAVNGQVATWSEAFETASLTFDLGKIGLEGGQLIFDGTATLNGLQQVNGPDVVRVRSLAYDQLLADGAIEIQLGHYANDTHFVGTFVGGSFATGVLGPQAIIPDEVGRSFGAFGTPAAEVRVAFGDGFYDKLGVQRSLPQGGANVEARINPGAGFTFAPPGTGALTINEFGYQKQPSASQDSVWLRVGGMYNTTPYRTFTTGRGVDNWALYALLDHQLTSDPKAPYRGLYVGGSAMYAPPEQNLFSQYYELRAYQFGPFDARPSDFASIVASYETYSREGRNRLAPPHLGAFATSSVIGSYAFHVRPGLYVQPGFGLTTNPDISRAYANVFNAYLSLTAFY